MSIHFAVEKRSLLAAAGWMAGCIPAVSQSAPTGPKAIAYDAVSLQPNQSANNMAGVQNSPRRYSAMGVWLKTLQKQLSLKPESTKRRVDTVVVVYVEMPSEN